MRRVRTPEYSASPEGQRERDAEEACRRGSAKRDAEEAEVEEERSPMVEVAPAKAQEVGAPEEIALVNPEVAAKTQVAGAPEAPAPTAVEELGACSHTPPPAPAAGAPAEVTPASTLRRWFHPAVTP